MVSSTRELSDMTEHAILSSGFWKPTDAAVIATLEFLEPDA
jgi:hypothetical protein